MKSMTAYATAQRSRGDQSAQVILRSLNFKYLDIYVHNLPPEDILLEEKIKRGIKKRVQRGKIEAFIFLAKPHTKKIYIDQKAIAKYISQIKVLGKKYNLRSDINISDILNLPQAILWEQKNRSSKTLILSTLREALDQLIKFKEKEGRAIKKEMIANLDKLKSNIKRIKRQIPKISKMHNGKDDIDEELSLMAFYITKLESKINSQRESTKGKPIDFLTQEILRELNAASSKTKKRTPALLIVEGKNYLERIREQAQNIE
ncbi:MAG: DUF1732 domain-containing protein [Candidatus Omnitrophota bacterium]